MEKDEIAKEIAEKKLNLLGDWLERAKDVHQAVPFIQDAYDQTKWQYDVLASLPTEARDQIGDFYLGKLNDSYKYMVDNLPALPPLQMSNVASLSAVTTADSTGTFQIITRVSSFESVQTHDWAVAKASEFRELQGRQNRINSIMSQLSVLDADRAQEFEKSVEAYKRAVSSTTDLTDAAIKIRNVLEHVKGELFEKAIRRPKEQKIRWPDMAARLAKGGDAGIECRNLKNEENTHKSLHDRLSRIAKNLDKITPEDLNNIFTEFVNHLFTVLNLIDRSHLS